MPETGQRVTASRVWALRRAIGQRLPLGARRWLVSRYGQAFHQWERLSDLVGLTIRGWGEKPQVYLPHYRIKLHNIWRTYETHPPLRYTSYPLAALCHWINSPPLPLQKACVIECEHILALAGDITRWEHGLHNLDSINRLVEHERCRFVFTYSAGLRDHSRRYLRSDLWPKFDYLYPCFPSQGEYPRPDPEPFTILSIASRFSDKGIPEALEAFRVLRDRHGARVRMIVVSQMVPADYPLPEGVVVYDTPRMSDSLKTRLFRSAHVLFIPCYSDSAVPIMEACAYGAPTISTRIHHDDEFVRDGVTGYLIEPPVYAYSEYYGTRWPTWGEFLADLEKMRDRGELQTVVDQAVDRLEMMISGGVDLVAMGRAARTLHAERFASEVRNAELLGIYQDALNARHYAVG